MREAFCSELVTIAEADVRVMLLTADLGFRVVEGFAERFPDRFFNVGVAEQNMLGIATGLADAGFIPFVYSISTFVSMRAYEFIRNGPVHHELPVRIIAVGGGFDYGSNGPTHHALEDVGIMRLQPGLQIVIPADADQARTALRATWESNGPVFYRLSKASGEPIRGLLGRFDPAHPITVRRGSDVLILALGPCVADGLRTAEEMERDSISCEVSVVSALGSIAGGALADLFARFRLVVTIENHYAFGGLGSVVAEIIADRGLALRLVRCGIDVTSDGRSGSTQWLNTVHGLDAASMAFRIREAFVSLDERHTVQR